MQPIFIIDARGYDEPELIGPFESEEAATDYARRTDRLNDDGYATTAAGSVHVVAAQSAQEAPACPSCGSTEPDCTEDCEIRRSLLRVGE